MVELCRAWKTVRLFPILRTAPWKTPMKLASPTFSPLRSCPILQRSKLVRSASRSLRYTNKSHRYKRSGRSPAPPPVRSLHEEVQADIRMLWTSYKAAIQAGTKFLFDLGKPGRIQQECRDSAIGKKLPDSLYVHRTAESQLSPLLRLMILTARQIVGEIDYDLVKIAYDGKKLSFLAYQDFDNTPHPALTYSLRIYLPKAAYGLRNYAESQNPPVLHRKQTFLDPLHPRFVEYAQLSARPGRPFLRCRWSGPRTGPTLHSSKTDHC